MFIPKTSYAKIAYDAILFYLTTGEIRKEEIGKIPDSLKLKCACIVSVFDADSNLKRSYGGVEPSEKILYDEIVENAIKSVSENKSLPVIKSEELNQLKVCIDVLSALHKIDDLEEVKPKKHGVFIKDTKGNSGFVMPNNKGLDTVEKQIEKAKVNAGIVESDHSKLEIFFFKSTRYD